MNRIRLYWTNKPSKGWRIAALMVIALFIATRYYAWTTAEHSNAQTVSERFNAVVQNDVSGLSNRFEIYADTLYSGRALFLADKSVSRQAWTEFVDAQDVGQRYPGVNGISYVTVIDRGQANAFTRQLNANRLPSDKRPFSITPASTASQLAVLTYVAPGSRSQQIIGYDLFTDPTRARMLDEARDSGAPRASVPLSLETDPKGAPPSLLIAMPVYNNSAALSTVKQRRAALKGFVTFSLHSKPMLDSVFQPTTPYGDITLTAVTNKQTVYSAGKRSAGQILQKNVDVDVAGQAWQLNFSASADFGLGRTARDAPVIILLSAIPLGLLLIVALYFATRLQILREHHRDHHYSGSDHEHN